MFRRMLYIFMKAHFIIHVKTMNANIFQGWPPWRTVKAVVANRARPWRARTTRNSSQATPFTHLSPEAAKIAPNGGASKPKRNSSPVWFGKKRCPTQGTIAKPRLEITVFLNENWNIIEPSVVFDVTRFAIRAQGFWARSLANLGDARHGAKKGAITIGQLLKLAFHVLFSRKVA